MSSTQDLERLREHDSQLVIGADKVNNNKTNRYFS